VAPFLAQLALELHVAVERVGERGRGGIALVLARRALVLVEAGGASQREDQPAAKGVGDLDAIGGDLAQLDLGEPVVISTENW